MKIPTNLPEDIKNFAEMYALGAISSSQLTEACSDNKLLTEAFDYAHAYSNEYTDFLNGLEKADKNGLAKEFNEYYFHKNMSVDNILLELGLISNSHYLEH